MNWDKTHYSVARLTHKACISQLNVRDTKFFYCKLDMQITLRSGESDMSCLVGRGEGKEMTEITKCTTFGRC